MIPDWLAAHAEGRPHRLAIQTARRSWTYVQLFEEATGFAATLRRLGIQPQEPVALLIRRGDLFALWVHALIQARAVLLPLNLRLHPEELQFQLADSQARFLLYDEASAELAQSLKVPGALLRVDSLEDSQEHLCREAIDLEEPQALLYTSGTTGRPKGVWISYRNHFFSALGSAAQLGLDPEERWLVPLPLFHVGGLGVLMRSLIYGTTAVIHERFEAEAVDHALEAEKITLVSLVPTMLYRLLELRQGPYPPSLRAILLGGSGAPRELLERAHKLGVPVCLSYGMTETNAQFATLPPSESLRKLGSSGLPLPGNQIHILTPQGFTRTPYTEGEIAVKGPTVTRGYHARPEANAQAFREGWFLTGDLGFLDEEGYLFVLERRTDLIISGGENIYPSEVEGVLLRHPLVEDAAVVAAPDPEWGQIPVAHVVLRKPEVSPEELQAFCRNHLAGYKVPKRFVIATSLPRNAAGKLLRRALRS